MASKQEPAYLVTNCAACAAPLAHDAPRCVRCLTRYCDDDYREDLRKALEIYEELVETSIRVHGEDHAMTESLLELLWESRNEQLDWSIDDLTPETRLAYHYNGQYEYSADSEEDADAADAAEVLAIL